MEFCAECGSLMKSVDHDGVEVWVCRECDYEEPRNPDKAYVIEDEQEVSEIIDISDAADTGLPTTDVACPACGGDRAFWYMQQIRAADESETRFFVCTSCEHKWREDDH